MARKSRARQMATKVRPGKPIVHSFKMNPRTRRIRYPNPVNDRISLDFVIRLTSAVFVMLLVTYVICNRLQPVSGLEVRDHGNSMRGIIDRYNMAPKPSTAQLQDEMRQEHAEIELFRNEVGRLRTENGLLMVNNLGDMTIQELHQLEKQLNDGLILVKQKKEVMLFNEFERSSRKVREFSHENIFLRGEIEKLKQFLSIAQHKADICTKTSANKSAQFAMGKEEDLTPVLDDQEFLLQGTHGINETFSRNFQEMDYSAEDSLGYPVVATHKRESVFERIGECVMAGKGKEQVRRKVENQAFVRGTEYGRKGGLGPVKDKLNKMVSKVSSSNEASKVDYEVKKDGRKQSNNTAGNVFTFKSFHVLNEDDTATEVDFDNMGTRSYMALDKEDNDVVPNLTIMTEEEYIALTEAVKEVMWIMEIVTEKGIDTRKTVVNCDNQSALLLSKHHVFHERSKHNNVKLHFKREVVESKFVTVCKVDTENAADMLTKCLTMEKASEVFGIGDGQSCQVV